MEANAERATAKHLGELQEYSEKEGGGSTCLSPILKMWHMEPGGHFERNSNPETISLY